MAGAGKNIAILAVAALLVVGLVVGVVVGLKLHNEAIKKHADNAVKGTSNKAVQAVCSSTDYQQTCQSSLANANTTEPKELIKIAFAATVDNIKGVIKNSTLLQQAAKDDRTKDAFRICEEVLGNAVDDIKKSSDMIAQFDPSKLNDYVEDLQTWISAVITYEETCIDAFENTTGDTGEKMKNLLKTGKELSSNALAMVSDIQSILSSMAVGKSSGSKRRLFGLNTPGEEPLFARRLFAAAVGRPRPNAVVAQDGSGQFKTISAAIAMVPKKNKIPFVIYVKAGLYKENVMVPKKADNIILYGDGPLRTIVTGRKSFTGGVKTFKTATFAVNSANFFAKDIAFENTAGPEGHQAVALRVSGDQAVFYNCHMNGYQDTLYNHVYRQYYRDCTISGTIDFVFGDSPSFFQNCVFVIRKPMANQACMVTAQGRIDPRSLGANIIQNGTVMAEPAFLMARPMPKAYLGRPWKQLSRTVFMQSYIGGSITPEGWSPWTGTFGQDTCYYAEFGNRGPGSNTARRVRWRCIQKLTPKSANQWTAGSMFRGNTSWITATGVPFVPTMMRV